VSQGAKSEYMIFFQASEQLSSWSTYVEQPYSCWQSWYRRSPRDVHVAFCAAGLFWLVQLRAN